MEFEIAVDGPDRAVDDLYKMLKSRYPTAKLETLGYPGSGASSRIVLTEDEATLDRTLKTVSRFMTSARKGRSGLEVRVRNLGYSEPPAGSERFRAPFSPAPPLTIQPWHPSHCSKPDQHTILLDPRHAFGTGKHPSTRLCLQWMVHEAERGFRGGPVGREILDFGCGSGLLAIAAVKLGARKAVGVDIDRPSVEAARRNVGLNAMEGDVFIRTGSWEVVQGLYDLVFANLVASVLLKTGGRIVHHLEDRGKAIVAGFSEGQAEEMASFLESTGLILVEMLHLEGWAALILKRVDGVANTG
jgi:ribosomal protein L11 methylase PrmA